MKKGIQVGIIGAGRIGRLHAETLSKQIHNVTVKAVSDVVVSAAESCAKEFHIKEYCSDYRKVTHDPEIQAVIICSNTDSHAQIIVDAANAGKDIFCEKPIALDLETIDTALKAVEKNNVKLQIGFNRRFDSNYRRIRRYVEDGDIGELHLVNITSCDPMPPSPEYIKKSGGLFLDMMIHDFDMVRYLTGDEVVQVYAEGAVLVDPAIGEAGDIDTAVVTLSMKKGTLCTITNSRKSVFGYDQRAEVFGSKGMALSDNNSKNNVRLCGEEKISRDLPLNFFIDRYTDSYREELTQFIQCVTNDTEPPVTGEDGRYPVLIAIAAKKSLDEHRPVEISEIKK